MKRAVLMFTAFATFLGAANAQYWKAMGRGTIGPTEIQTLYGDSVSDRLLAGGPFLKIMNDVDTILAYGQAAWDGHEWDSIAHRIAPAEGQTFLFLRFQGKLYSCGGYIFLTPDGEANASFARLNEETQYWEALECINADFGGMLTLVPKVPDTTLYATGYTGSICGYPLSCVFRYDGSAFHIWEPFNQIPADNDNYVGYVFNYQGMTYMTGSFRDPLGPGYVTFLRYNGTAWEHVPGWNTLSPIKAILIQSNTLYVAGAFRLATGGPGDLIASFDGVNWNGMGDGLLYTPVPMSSVVWDLKWFHGELLACGLFSRAGNVPCTSIAQWNGNRWCALPGDIRWQNNAYPMLEDMAIWRDSLYICGGINTIDGDTIRQVAQWIGGDAVGECSTVGMNEPVAHSSALGVYPLDEPGSWNVQFPKAGRWTLCAFDALGRPVGTWHSSGPSLILDLNAQVPGMYLLRASSTTGELRSAKVIRP